MSGTFRRKYSEDVIERRGVENGTVRRDMVQSRNGNTPDSLSGDTPFRTLPNMRLQTISSCRVDNELDGVKRKGELTDIVRG